MQLKNFVKYAILGMAVMLTACDGSSSRSGKNTSSTPVNTGGSSSQAISSAAVSSAMSSLAPSSVGVSSIASSTASSTIAVVEDKTLVLPSSLEVVTNENAK